MAVVVFIKQLLSEINEQSVTIDGIATSVGCFNCLGNKKVNDFLFSMTTLILFFDTAVRKTVLTKFPQMYCTTAISTLL